MAADEVQRLPGGPAVSSLQAQARALGDPTRHRIFTFAAESAEPVGVRELAGYFGLHHNAIRQHLVKLRDAGLVEELVEDRREPGRPRLLYRIGAEAAGQWLAGGPYQRLAELLLEVIAEGQEPRSAGRRAGQRLARSRASGASQAEPSPEAAIDAVEAIAAHQGFRPQRRQREGATELVFGRCPTLEAASKHPGIVCAVHLGLTEGVLEEAGGAKVRRLVPTPATGVGCRVVFE